MTEGENNYDRSTPPPGNEFNLIGTGQQQVDAVRMFAYSRSIPGAPKPKLRLPGDNHIDGNFAKAFWSLVRERGMFRRDVRIVMINEESQRLDFVDPEMVKMWADDNVALYRVRTVPGAGPGESPDFKEVYRSMTAALASCVIAQVRVTPQLLARVDKVNYAPMPVQRADGKVELLAKDYDVESRTFTFDCGFPIERMKLEDAVAFWNEQFGQFPFGDGVDDPARSKAVLLAEQLTLFASGLLPKNSSRPMFVHNANTQRSGKTLTAEMSLFAVFGSANSVDWIDNHEEFRKELNTQAGSATPYIFFDNVKSSLSSPVLEKFVTASEISFRVMGKNTEVMKVPNVATVIISSNNAAGSTDVAQRALYVNLYVAEANAQDRKIERPLDKSELVKPEWRGKMLSALWSIVKHWDEAGRPLNETKLVGFEQWSAIIGGIVKAAGFVDPLMKPIMLGAGDSTEQQMNALATALLTCEEGRDGVANEGFEVIEADEEKSVAYARSFTFGQLAHVCSVKGLFDHYVPEDGEMKPADRSKFGKFLRKWINRGRNFTLAIEGRNRRVVLQHNGESGRGSRFIVSEVA